jgi:hypothetical protein
VRPDWGDGGRRARIEHVQKRLLVLVLTVLLGLPLSSCGGDDTPAAPKDSSGIPAYARSYDEKGAQNFARYWIDTFNEATTTGDTKKLKSLNKASCTTCADFAKTIDDVYAQGGRIETKGLKVKNLVSEANIPKPGAGVSVTLSATPQKVFPTKDAKPKVYKQTDVRLRLILVRVQQHWVMNRIDPA